MIFERLNGSRLSRILRTWEGQTVVCAATGPSLTPDQLELVRAAKVPLIAVNDACFAAPWANVVYFADEKWWRWKKDLPEWRSFAGEKCTISLSDKTAVAEDVVHALRNARTPGLSTDPTAICTGSNSGYQAINVAVLSGAKRVVLIGYDCRAVDGKDHYFGAHPDKTAPPYAAIKVNFGHLVKPTAEIGVEIVNATPASSIECFRTMSLADSLQPHQTGTVVPA